MDWFFGFKLHLVVNDGGELLACCLTTGNTDDRRPVPKLVKRLFGKLCGDKEYLRIASLLNEMVDNNLLEEKIMK